jgi:hypothetical protein
VDIGFMWRIVLSGALMLAGLMTLVAGGALHNPNVTRGEPVTVAVLPMPNETQAPVSPAPPAEPITIAVPNPTVQPGQDAPGGVQVPAPVPASDTSVQSEHAKPTPARHRPIAHGAGGNPKVAMGGQTRRSPASHFTWQFPHDPNVGGAG